MDLVAAHASGVRRAGSAVDPAGRRALGCVALHRGATGAPLPAAQGFGHGRRVGAEPPAELGPYEPGRRCCAPPALRHHRPNLDVRWHAGAAKKLALSAQADAGAGQARLFAHCGGLCGLGPQWHRTSVEDTGLSGCSGAFLPVRARRGLAGPVPLRVACHLLLAHGRFRPATA